MTRYLFLILFALAIVACGSSPIKTPDLATTQALAEETAQATLEAPPPSVSESTATPPPANTSTQTTEIMPASTATQQAAPSAIPTSVIPATPEVTLRIQDGMSMVYVPAGGFIMGNMLGAGSDEEAPPHLVTLDGYWIDRTEVTNAQYRAFMNATGYRAPELCSAEDITYTDADLADHPVACVNWDDAQAYCAWVGGRLPTEAEWEKAARGVDERVYPWGGLIFDGSRTNYCDASCELSENDPGTNDGYARSAPVGSFPEGASPYGALDMAGNAWEWVNDWYNFGYYARSPQDNPQGFNIGDYRVLRGGGWSSSASNARTTFRAWLAPEEGDRAIGFRCVVTDMPSP